MSEPRENQPPEGTEELKKEAQTPEHGSAGDATGPGDAGNVNAAATPRIGDDDQNKGETQRPAPDDETGGAEGEPDRTD